MQNLEKLRCQKKIFLKGVLGPKHPASRKLTADLHLPHGAMADFFCPVFFPIAPFTV
jgi:hypothetical protein